MHHRPGTLVVRGNVLHVLVATWSGSRVILVPIMQRPIAPHRADVLIDRAAFPADLPVGTAPRAVCRKAAAVRTDRLAAPCGTMSPPALRIIQRAMATEAQAQRTEDEHASIKAHAKIGMANKGREQ